MSGKSQSEYIYIKTGGGSLRLYTHAAVAEDIVCFYFSLTSTNLILRLLFCENEDGRAAPALLGHNCPKNVAATNNRKGEWTPEFGGRW